MSLSLLAAPQEEALTLADAKVFAKIETNDDDLVVQALITSARLHIEALTRRFLVTQTWRLSLPAMPSTGRIPLPVSPVQSILAARIREASGNAVPLDPSAYQADLTAAPPLITLGSAVARGVRIEFDLVLGYGAASAVPQPLRHALRLLVAGWYEERGNPPTARQLGLPAGVRLLLAPFCTPAL